MRRALVVGCAMVLIGSVTAVIPVDSVSTDEAIAASATSDALAAAEARAMGPFATLLADRGWR